MKFLFTSMTVLILLSTLRAEKDGTAALERPWKRDVDEIQNDVIDMRRREDNEDDYVLMCTRDTGTLDTRKGCVKVRLRDMGK